MAHVTRSPNLVGRANLLLLVALAAVVGLVAWVVRNGFEVAQQTRVLSQQTYDVLGAIKDLDLALREAETGQRGFLLTGKEPYLDPYYAAISRVGALQDRLRRLTTGDAVAQGRMRELAPLIHNKFAEMSSTVALRRTVGMAAALQVVATDVGRAYTVQIQAALDAMLQRQQDVLAERLRALNSQSRLVGIICLVALAGAGVALLLAAWLLNLAWTRSAVLQAEQHSLAARLRTSLDSISQGVAVFDGERCLSDSNHCFQVLLDLPSELLQPGTHYGALALHLERPEGSLLETEPQIVDGERAGSGWVSYERVTATRRQLELRRTPMGGFDGRSAPGRGFVLTVSDMSKRAEAEAVLREAQKMQAIGQLTGGIAHDFNNLLTVILGNLEFVARRLQPEQRDLATWVERANWAAQRGATLTSQLLAFARRQPLAPAPINLGETIPALIPLLRRTLGEHIQVRFVDSAGLWPAMADPVQLESAVLNLALNARDAMPRGGQLTVELANKVLDPDYASGEVDLVAGDYTMVAVSDTGTGMTAEIRARVFEPFFTTKPDGKGTGLGLAMVFGFIKQSGGHIKIYSEPGEGTTVRMYLPRAIGAVGTPRMEAPVVVPRGTATVLVVEDDAAVRDVAVGILQDLGYRVLQAEDGAVAVRVLAEHGSGIDLLLTDVVLPGKLRGRDLADQVFARYPRMRVLFMSGYSENAIIHHGRLDDGVQLISKPFKRDQLAQKVAQVLNMAEAGA